MTEYRVTFELHTPIWKSILRFIGMYTKREEFTLSLTDDVYQKGDILSQDHEWDMKVLGKIKPKRKFELDPRLKFLKDPIIQVCILAIIGLVGIKIWLYHQKEEYKKPKIKIEQIKSDAPLSEIRKDTTEWRRQYYNHLYWN
jgi:hypothetical protein